MCITIHTNNPFCKFYLFLFSPLTMVPSALSLVFSFLCVFSGTVFLQILIDSVLRVYLRMYCYWLVVTVPFYVWRQHCSRLFPVIKGSALPLCPSSQTYYSLLEEKNIAASAWARTWVWKECTAWEHSTPLTDLLRSFHPHPAGGAGRR